MKTSEKLLTKEDVANLCGVNKQTVLKWGRVGRLKCIRIGYRTVRFSEEQVTQFLKGITA